VTSIQGFAVLKHIFYPATCGLNRLVIHTTSHVYSHSVMSVNGTPVWVHQAFYAWRKCCWRNQRETDMHHRLSAAA